MFNSSQSQIESPERKFLGILDKSMYSGLWPLSDGHICTDDGCVFNIHRVILARGSEYFRILFLGSNNHRSEVSVPGITGDCLSNILIYLYTGQVHVTEANVTDLLVGSDYLKLTDLYTIVKNRIQDFVTDYNCIRLLHAAYFISDECVFQKCFRYVQTEFQKVCCRKDDLVELPLEILLKLLRSPSLVVNGESTVWQAIVDWTEKDISNRSHHVPQLISCLASEEIGEELSTEIVSNAIVSENAFIKTVKRNRCLNNSPDNLALLQSILHELVHDDNIELYSFRIPARLHIILLPSDACFIHKIVNLFYSYDENPDLWLKTTHTDFRNYPDIMIANHDRIYVFEMYEKQCKYFTFNTMEWMVIAGFRNSFTYRHYVVTIGKYIYILGEAIVYGRRCEYAVEVLDTENNAWSAVVAPSVIKNGKAVTVCGRIYVLNDDFYNEMAFHVFDPDSQQWSVLPIPNIHRNKFVFVSYHQKIYVIGGDYHLSFVPKPEVFDPNTNKWNGLVGFPFEFRFLDAVVFQDKILVYGEDTASNKRHLIWNEKKESWEELEANIPFLNKLFVKYCSIADVETKKLIRRQRRDTKLTLDEVLKT